MALNIIIACSRAGVNGIILCLENFESIRIELTQKNSVPAVSGKSPFSVHADFQ